MRKTFIIIAVVLTFSSCKKDTTNQPAPDPITTNNKLSKIIGQNDVSEISYNANGTMKSILNKFTNGTLFSTMNFNYENNQLKEMIYGATKLKYTLIGGLVTKVETVNGVGVPTHRNEFSYLNTKITEVMDYWPMGTNGLQPFSKTTFSYNNAGNVSRSDYYERQNGAWIKLAQNDFAEYDSKINTCSSFENFIYLPNLDFCKNNPLKEVNKDENGIVQQTVTHVYLYDALGRPTQRTTTTKIPGTPDIVDITKFEY